MTREERIERIRLRHEEKQRIACIKKESLEDRAKARKEKDYNSSVNWRLAQKKEYYTLYYIPSENYIGISFQPSIRMYAHKYSNRDTTNWVTIKTFKTKREALDAERFYHSIGYEGANKQSKLINPII